MEEKIICSLSGVAIYGIISICIFVAFFTGMLLWAFTKKANYLDKMGHLPLDGAENDSKEKPNAEQL